MTWIVPMWAMIGCTLFGALVLTGTTRYLFRHRLVAAFRDLPQEKTGRLVILEDYRFRKTVVATMSPGCDRA